MKSPFSRTFRIFLGLLVADTLSRYTDPNEIFNKRPIIALEVVKVDGQVTTESLQADLYTGLPTGYKVEVVTFKPIGTSYNR